MHPCITVATVFLVSIFQMSIVSPMYNLGIKDYSFLGLISKRFSWYQVEQEPAHSKAHNIAPRFKDHWYLQNIIWKESWIQIHKEFSKLNNKKTAWCFFKGKL